MVPPGSPERKKAGGALRRKNALDALYSGVSHRAVAQEFGVDESTVYIK